MIHISQETQVYLSDKKYCIPRIVLDYIVCLGLRFYRVPQLRRNSHFIFENLV